jgi:GNAT superfamily N-acetyltransferase
MLVGRLKRSTQGFEGSGQTGRGRDHERLARCGVTVSSGDQNGDDQRGQNYGRNRARSLYYDAEIYELYLRPECQGVGLGRRLFDAALCDDPMLYLRLAEIYRAALKILEAVEIAMGIRSDKIQVSRDVLCNFGNMSSATVLFILESLLNQGASAPCVMLAFGPGLVGEAALLL